VRGRVLQDILRRLRGGLEPSRQRLCLLGELLQLHQAMVSGVFRGFHSVSWIVVVSAFTLPRMPNLQTKAPETEPQDWLERQVRRRLKRELKERLDELKEARSPMKPINVFLGEHQIADDPGQTIRTIRTIRDRRNKPRTFRESSIG
jgi:hypothetical protein